jgi:hypothetical protein
MGGNHLDLSTNEQTTSNQQSKPEKLLDAKDIESNHIPRYLRLDLI